jgi:hypothetical protein
MRVSLIVQVLIVVMCHTTLVLETPAFHAINAVFIQMREVVHFIAMIGKRTQRAAVCVSIRFRFWGVVHQR